MSVDDIALWPDGTWCYGDEVSEMGFMSDDFEVLRFGTQPHKDFLNDKDD